MIADSNMDVSGAKKIRARVEPGLFIPIDGTSLPRYYYSVPGFDNSVFLQAICA